MVEKIVFLFILLVAAGGCILGCIYEFGGKKSTPKEEQNSGEDGNQI